LGKPTANEEKERILSNYRSSGKSQKAWCEENGMNLHTLRNWCRSRSRSKTVNASQQTKEAEWVEIPLKISTPVSKNIQIEKDAFIITVSEDYNKELLLSVLKTMSKL
jgi:transposase-like protein